jgi:hypothetical protein
MAKTIAEIGGLQFPTKSAALSHFRAMLHRHAVGSIIPDPDAAEFAWLLERHQEVHDKIASGVKQFAQRALL